MRNKSAFIGAQRARLFANFFGVLTLGAVTLPSVYASESEPFANERKWFIEARNAIDSGDRDRYTELKQKLTDYPLASYLDYLGLSAQFGREKAQKRHVSLLNAFEKKFQDESLTRKLTRKLQKRSASAEDWPLFLGLKKSTLAAEMPCTTVRARVETGELTHLDEQALELWKRPVKHPEVCAAALTTLEKAKTPPISAIWERIYSAMADDRPEFAESLLHYLGSRDRKRVSDWIAALDEPKSYLSSNRLKEDTMLNRRMLVDLVLAWSKDDPVAAMAYWQASYSQYTFFKDRYYDTHRLLAMRGAYRRLPESYAWLNSLDARDDDLELKEWRIRAALFEQDWINVLRSLKRLPKEEQEEDHWAYWEARALQEAGHEKQANAIFSELSTLPTYHGFLAADQVGADYAIVDEPIEENAAELARLRADNELIRAREFYAVDIPWEGRRAWNKAVSKANAEQLASLAVLAEEWQMLDRAIMTAYRADKKRALSLRFPIIYQPEVEAAALKNEIDPAWIFGVMRRESSYIRDVKSSAGAVGLMQLMPATAKYVAKLQGDKNFRGDLTDASTNIGLGSYYLRHVMDKFDNNQVLATASYNAGPRRVGIWLPEAAMPADVWIDAIPYSETRRYVRAVLAYTAIYEWHLTRTPLRLTEKLASIPAAAGT